MEIMLLMKDKYIITVQHDLSYNFSLKTLTPNRGYEFTFVTLSFISLHEQKKGLGLKLKFPLNFLTQLPPLISMPLPM